MALHPRLDPIEVEYFEALMHNKAPDTKMVEWGSGGSTIMFLPHFATGYLTSIEHNREWFDKVITEVQANFPDSPALKNFTYILAEPEHKGKEVDIRFWGYGVPFEENPCFARRYINPETKDNPIFDADIYFVDGICRGAILATIMQNARHREAHVYIHDYFGHEERESWYEWASSMYSDIEQIGTTLARLWI